MANVWLSVNRKRIDNTLMSIEALKLKGGFEEVGLDAFKYLIKSMEQEIKNLTKDIELLKEENEKLLDLFKDDEKEKK